MTKSNFLLYLCLLFVSGIVLNSLVKIPLFWQGILFFLSILIIVFQVIKEKRVLVLGFSLLALLVGVVWHQKAMVNDLITEAGQYYGQEVILEGIIVSEPEKRINQQKFQFRSEGIPSNVLITVELYPEYYYGDRLKISGKLQEPFQFEDFDYKQYLAKDKIYLVSYWPIIIRLSQNQGNYVFQRIFNFKDKLRNVIGKTLLPPQSAILSAILLGDKYGLSDSLKEKLNLSGTRHIVAISGMHMIIMTQILLFLALALGLWRNQAFYFVLILLILYIIMIGAPASAVRAGVMAGLLLLAQRLGRLRSADRAIVYTATAMLIVNPLLLKADVGFQLSFVATLSIIYLKPILDEKTINWFNPMRLKDILTMTIAAQLGVLPLLIFHFGRLSLISPLANLLIVPFLPLIMISGIILSLSGLIWLSLAEIIAWPVWFLLTYVLKVIEYLSSFPWAAYEFENISWVVLSIYYLVLVGFVWYQKKKANLLI